MVRIGGLASGMDIDTLVSDLMKAERIPLDKLTQKKQILEWQRDDYRSMNQLLSDFDDFIFDNLTLQRDLVKKTATSSISEAVTATASASAGNINTSIKVNSLATSANWISSSAISYNKDTTFPTDTEIQLKITNGDGTLSTVNNSDNTTTDVIKLTIKAGSTLDDVLKQLSSKKELGISAFSESGNIVITKNDTGAGSSIELANDAAKTLFSSFGFAYADTTDTPQKTMLNDKTNGTNSDFEINGLKVTNRASNTFTINDVTYMLNNTTGTEVAKISVSSDTDNMLDKIVQFVDKYNEMIEKINGKLTEERYRSYQPLTKEEEDSLTEKQVEQWEEKAKSGLLKNDSILSSALTKMRTALYTPFSGSGVNSDYSQLAEIGITTSSNYLEKGKLEIDPEKLRVAIDGDPNAVFELFSASGTSTETKGVTKRLRDSISDTIKSIEEKAGKSTLTNQQFSIGRNLSQIDSQISRFEDRLLQVEDRYWRQFTAMEKAIQQSNSQMSYLMQQFSS